MKILFWLLAWSVTAAVQGSVHAANYVVSTSGNDANTGSESQPWRTIQKAANTVLPGDVVMVKRGDYGELVNFARPATPGQPITFRSDGAEVGGFNCRKSDYVIQGFRLGGTNASMASAGALVYVYADAHRVQVLDNYFHDSPGSKYGVWLTQGPGTDLAKSSSFNVISNNAFVGIDYINICGGGASNRFIRNLFKDSNGQADIFRLWGEGHVAADNFVTNISALVENHSDFFQVFGPQTIRTTNDYSVVRNIVLERNVVADSRIQICQLETFLNPPGHMTNLVFRNNVFINISYAANVDMDGTKWFNNLFCRVNYGNGGHVFAFGGPKGSAYGTEIINNVFYECGNGQDWVGWYPTVGLGGITNFNVRADHNFVCGPGFAPKQTFALSPNGWGSQGQDAHGINGGNPGFASASIRDFRLAAGSPLINAGGILSGFANDLLGRSRSDGRWDIGPYEYQVEGRPSAPGNLRTESEQ
ncbi:MAG TPA: choice-of-anchor Q domain-containing protein [Verrucomicrobiota bacterium]|nr:choice-of-anchor Q domain-containing protein [Verrucomicrobiota bacterium]